MLEKNNKEKSSTLTNSLIGLSTVGLSGGLILNMLGGMNKMFGSNDIPKGVVRELMEGVMDGLTIYFEQRIADLKRENEEFNNKIEELEIKLEELDIIKKELDNLHEKNINLNKENNDLIFELKKKDIKKKKR